MNKMIPVKPFEDQRIRTVWNEEKQEWLFSIVNTGIANIISDRNLSHTEVGKSSFTEVKRLKKNKEVNNYGRT